MVLVTRCISWIGILVLALAMVVFHLQKAEAQAFEQSDAWQQVPSRLAWTTNQMRDVARVVNEKRHNFNVLLAANRRVGAVKMVQIYDGPLDPEFHRNYPEYKNLGNGLVWVGLSASGKRVDVTGDALLSDQKTSYFPRVDELFQLNQNGCSLLHWNLFDPATWFQTECRLIVPKYSDVLRVSLISSIRPEYDFAGSATEALDEIANNRAPYSVRAGRIYCSTSISKYCSQGFPLIAETGYGTKVEISIGPGKWDFTQRVISVAAQTIANHMALDNRKDDFHSQVITPWANGPW